MKVFLALVVSLSMASVFAEEAGTIGQTSTQAVDCEKILASQGAKPAPVAPVEDDTKGKTGTVSQ